MIPYLVPELPAAQKAALHKLVKTPLVYTSVALRELAGVPEAGHQPGQRAGRLSHILLAQPADGDRRLPHARRSRTPRP